MKKLLRKPGLVTKSLEFVSKEIFTKYAKEITELVDRSSGVYALYDDGELYYVGRATTLRSRVKQHLRDRHGASWTHFSFYLISNDDHIGEIESLLIRIANPQGNTVKPKGFDSRSLMKTLLTSVKQRQQEERNLLLSNGRNSNARKAVETRDLKGIVSKRTPIYRQYKGKEYKAYLTKTGMITCKGKQYSSPTGAARAIVKIKRVNGWRFWYIRNRQGDWVKLAEYK